MPQYDIRSFSLNGSHPIISMFRDGRFILGWSFENTFYVQGFEASGAPALAAWSMAYDAEPIYSMATFNLKDMVLAWAFDHARTLYVQRFTEDGIPQSARLKIASGVYSSAVTTFTNEDFIVAWSTVHNGISWQIFTADAVAKTSIFSQSDIQNRKLPELLSMYYPSLATLDENRWVLMISNILRVDFSMTASYNAYILNKSGLVLNTIPLPFDCFSFEYDQCDTHVPVAAINSHAFMIYVLNSTYYYEASGLCYHRMSMPEALDVSLGSVLGRSSGMMVWADCNNIQGYVFNTSVDVEFQPTMLPSAMPSTHPARISSSRPSRASSSIFPTLSPLPKSKSVMPSTQPSWHPMMFRSIPPSARPSNLSIDNHYLDHVGSSWAWLWVGGCFALAIFSCVVSSYFIKNRAARIMQRYEQLDLEMRQMVA